MKSLCRLDIARISILALFCFLLAYTTGICAENNIAAVRVINIPGDSIVTLILKNVSDNEPASGDIISWSSVLAGESRWKIADQYLEIVYDNLPPTWGMQIYTHNKNEEGDNPANPRYIGNDNPAGLVKVSNPVVVIPMAWRIVDTPLSQDELVNPTLRIDKTGFADSMWHFVKDRNTPDDTTTPENEAFTDGEDYVTIWNQRGMAWHESARANPRVRNTAYVYFASDFTTSHVSAAYTTSTLTLDVFEGISPLPFYVYKEGANATGLAYQFLNAKMDKYLNGGKLRLIESYTHPADYGIGDLPAELQAAADELSGKAFTYDNALTICALLANPDDNNLQRAKLLCKALIWVQDNIDADGRVRDAYDATQELKAGYTQPDTYPHFISANGGNAAWAIIAMMQYYKNSQDPDTGFMSELRRAAVGAGEFIHNNLFDAGQSGYFYGYDAGGILDGSKSTENNLAIYVAFSHLYDMTDNADWLTRANNAKGFVNNIAKRPLENRFIIGLDAAGNPNENVLAADTNLLTILGLGTNIPSVNDYLDYVTGNFYTRYSTNGGYTDDNFIGIDFGYVNGDPGEPDGVWFEGTAQLASVCQLLGTTGVKQIATEYLKSIELAQDSALYANYSGITAASEKITTGLGYSYYPFPHIGATSSYIAASREYNILWGIPLTQPVPVPGDNISYTPETIEYPIEYLENHYAPSGWMAGGGYTFLDAKCRDNPYSGDTCFRIHLATGWNGIVWQEPLNEWFGSPDKGYDLRSATKLSFWIRASKNTVALISMGYEPDALVPGSGDGDSCGSIPWDDPDKLINIGTDWQLVEIDLEAMNNPAQTLDMLHVSNGFTIVIADNFLDIFLDDIKYDVE